MTENKEPSTHYDYFCNRECEYFPCHPAGDENDFNCLFCFCPLYALGERCGGNFTYLSNGYKDCSECMFPHSRRNYQAILARYEEILEVSRLVGRKE